MGLFSRTISVNTGAEKVRELLTRGVGRVFPSADFVEKRLLSGERLTVYLGIDPTGPTLHLGHIVPLLKLSQFQELGHKVILLIGDFTAAIGDPTDKSAARKKLTRDNVLSNAKLYKEQASRIIKFKGDNPAALRYNSEWLGKLSFAEALELCSSMTHAQAIKRDMFQKRIAENKDLFLHELLYPLMQGYDSVVMDVDGEIGGNDQTFNMLAGRDLLKKMKNKEKFVLATKLLIDTVGGKIGKTEGNMLAFSDSPSDMFGKIMSWPDGMIFLGFELCTRVPLIEIGEMQKKATSGANPRDFKARLAREIASLYHGEEKAERAEKEFNQTFRDKAPAEFIDIKLRGRSVADALLEHRVISSKSELRRLIEEGGVTKLQSGEKADISFFEKAAAGEYRLGKHRFVRIH